jgi:hypothetical protein
VVLASLLVLIRRLELGRGQAAKTAAMTAATTAVLMTMTAAKLATAVLMKAIVMKLQTSSWLLSELAKSTASTSRMPNSTRSLIRSAVLWSGGVELAVGEETMQNVAFATELDATTGGSSGSRAP